jgi:hypothetical protein
MRPKALWKVYAFAPADVPRRFRIAGHWLTSIAIPRGSRRRDGAIAALAERVFEPCLPSEASLREQHAIVLEIWRRTGQIIPVRFGTIMSEADLTARVAAQAPALARKLQQFDGRVQMTVRVFEDVPSPERGPLPSTSGTAYLKAVRDRAAAVSRLAADVRSPVESLVLEERLESGRGPLRLSLFHLIAARDEAQYRAALEVLAGESSRRIAVSGPWPPFAFAPELST